MVDFPQVVSVVATMVRAGVITPLRPDKYIRIMAAAQRDGLSATSGFAMSAQRSPDRAALIDELGTLTYREIDHRGDALAAALQDLPGSAGTIGIMCRNHRGFVESLIAANRVGADVLLLNTSFAGPAVAEVVSREGVDVMIYDEEFSATVDTALTGNADTTRILGWTDNDPGDVRTVEALVAKYVGRHPEKPPPRANSSC